MANDLIWFRKVRNHREIAKNSLWRLHKTTDKLFELFTSRLELDIISMLQTSSMTICYSSILD